MAKSKSNDSSKMECLEEVHPEYTWKQLSLKECFAIFHSTISLQGNYVVDEEKFSDLYDGDNLLQSLIYKEVLFLIKKKEDDSNTIFNHYKVNIDNFDELYVYTLENSGADYIHDSKTERYELLLDIIATDAVDNIYKLMKEHSIEIKEYKEVFRYDVMELIRKMSYIDVISLAIEAAKEINDLYINNKLAMGEDNSRAEEIYLKVAKSRYATRTIFHYDEVSVRMASIVLQNYLYYLGKDLNLLRKPISSKQM